MFQQQKELSQVIFIRTSFQRENKCLSFHFVEHKRRENIFPQELFFKKHYFNKNYIATVLQRILILKSCVWFGCCLVFFFFSFFTTKDLGRKKSNSNLDKVFIMHVILIVLINDIYSGSGALQ